MKGFFIRILNAFLIMGGIFAYNSIWEQRALAEENSRLQAELASANLRLEQKNREMEDDSPQESKYKDGIYEGTGTGFGGEITVQVTITQGQISGLEIVSAEQEDQAYLKTAGGIVERILEEQSADVDTISGATFSSTGIKEAAAEALEQAEGKE